MARPLLDTVRACVRRHELLVAGDVVVAAVSGGADSLALLRALLALRDTLDIRIAVAHLDHRVRGGESARDRAFVEGIAKRHGLPYVGEEATIPAGNFEAEARSVRYAFLERAADALGATKIATGHTRDDQAETVLWRVVRGAGRRGLGGIRPRHGRIVRPLLDCDRTQVRAFLVERGQDWRRDYGNFDFDLERTRLRHGFLPALSRELNPRLARTLADLADLMREEDALLDRLASAAARGQTLAAPILHAIDAPLARRAIRLWWRRHGSGARLGRAHVEAVRRLAARPSDDGAIAVPGGAIARERSRLTFFPADRSERGIEPWRRDLPRGGTVDTPGGWRLTLGEAAPREPIMPGHRVCVVDADALAGGLAVRNRRAGDAIRLHGLGGHTSLKRLFASRRIPRRLRADHPVVVCGDVVLWVPDCGRSEVALVGPATTRRWVIRASGGPRESA
ncbi:MAG: tRNA lysidine(34) synthetase TilS [Deltaproteobacteria bacterium]|nr:tRNA lysidine(34) synthetase TilS [Deltaproteobacteria bacterium]